MASFKKCVLAALIVILWPTDAYSEDQSPPVNEEPEQDDTAANPTPKASPLTDTMQESHPKVLDLLIESRLPKNEELVGARQITFNEICSRIGELLTRNQGLWGTGPFQHFSCTTKRSKRVRDNQWKLTITAMKESLILKIHYTDPSTRRDLILSSYTIEAPLSPLQILNDNRYLQMISAYLSFKLPFRSAISEDQVIQGDKIQLPGKTIYDLPPVRSDISFFTMNRQNNRWKIYNFAKGKLIAEGNADPSWEISMVKSSKGPPKNTFSSGYQLIHHQKDRKEALVKLDETLKKEIANQLNRLLASVRSAYVGARYGMPVGSGEGVFAESPLIGILGEFRSGILDGFRIYYDFRPKKQAKTADYTESFGMSRLQLGYGFGRSLNSSIINWYDVMPKIGTTTLDLEVRVNQDTSPETYRFKLTRAPTIGLEIGTEKRAQTVTVRLWVYGNYSLGVSALEKNSSTSSFRLGLDLYKDLFSFVSIKIAINAFTAFETTNFKIKSQSASFSDARTIESISYNSLFAGGGLALSW